MTGDQLLRIGAFWNTLGFLMRFIIGFASSVIFVRILGQYSYGIVTFIVSGVFLIGIIINLGFGTVISQYIAIQRVDGGKNLIIPLLKKVTSLRIFAWASLSWIFIFSQQISTFLEKGYLSEYLYFIPILVLSTYFQGTFKTVLTSHYDQKFINSMLVLDQILKLFFVLLGFYLDFKIVGFLSAIFLSQILTGILLGFRSTKLVFSSLKKTRDSFSLGEKLPLALHSFSIAISTRLLGRESDLLLLGIFHPDIREVAIYAVVFGLPNMVFDLFRSGIGGGLGLTIFTEQANKNDYSGLRKSYYKILHIFSIVLFPTIIGGCLTGGELAVLMYGDEYKGLNLLLEILFIALGISSVNAILTDLLLALSKSRLLMRIQILMGLINILINIIVIPEFGALGVAVSTGLINIGLTAILIGMTHQILKPDYPFFRWFRYLGITFIMGGVIDFVGGFLFQQILTGMLTYSLLFSLQAFIFEDREVFNSFFKMVFKRR